MGKFDWLRPKPKPPIEPTVKVVRVRVGDFSAAPLSNASVSLQTQIHTWENAITDLDGVAIFNNVPYHLFNSHILIAKQGYKPIDRSIITPLETEVNLEYFLEKLVPEALPLTVGGTNFFGNGSLIRLQGITDFTGLQDFIEADFDKLNLILEFARAIGSNLVRVLGEIGWTNFDPSFHSDYYSQLDAYFKWCKTNGLFVDYNCFAFKERYNTIEQAHLHVAKTSAIAAKYSNVLYTLGNEPWKNIPFDLSPLHFTADIDKGALWNYGAHEHPKVIYEPPGNFVSEHTPRDGEWFRKAKHCYDTQEMFHVPDLLAEPMGAISVLGTGTSNQRDNDPRHFLEYFATASLFGSSVFHSEELKFGRVPKSREFECALAAARGWELIPLEYLLGHYTALHLSDCPIEDVPGEILRAYFKVFGNTAKGVLIQPTDNFEIKPQNGWRLVDNKENCVITLTR